MLVTAGKSGATMNYFIEWMCVWSVLIGLLVARTVARWSDRPSGAMCLAGAPADAARHPAGTTSARLGGPG